ncbi:unnamed protein product [Pleuronectes platessa]|uniref:Uncharacterized protein n=1 Tax=Pleuronectes platessa TaxID=8262 RepID=A0A9N7YLA9_PLEPL|nr:unnamed protein product [Pleuronectes platessa]
MDGLQNKKLLIKPPDCDQPSAHDGLRSEDQEAERGLKSPDNSKQEHIDRADRLLRATRVVETREGKPGRQEGGISKRGFSQRRRAHAAGLAGISLCISSLRSLAALMRIHGGWTTSPLVSIKRLSPVLSNDDNPDPAHLLRPSFIRKYSATLNPLRPHIDSHFTPPV